MSNFADREGMSEWFAESRDDERPSLADVADWHQPVVRRRGFCKFRLDDGEMCENGAQLDEHTHSPGNGWVCPNDSERRSE